MPVIVCENKNCKHISKRRSMFVNGLDNKVLRHTCRATLVNIGEVSTGDDSIEDYLGYTPYECIYCKRKGANK